MDLKIKDVADLLNVSESTIRRWVNEKKIPAYWIDQHLLFSRSEIENWVIEQKLHKAHGASPFETEFRKEAPEPRKTGGVKRYGLYRAIHKGAVLHHVAGVEKEAVIRHTMKQTAHLLKGDADVLSDLLLDRERLMPTALNNGIAVPHMRDSLLQAHHDVVITVFLDQPLDYGALDNKPVHTLFFLFACDDKRHLHLLAKIAHLSHHPEALDFFQTKPSKESMLTYVKEWEELIPKH